MRILLTGATGFLGKQLLELLIHDQRIESIWVTSRKKRSHPHPKVEVVPLDLSNPAQLANFEHQPDAVIHLAGLYDFDEDYRSCYTQNVLPAIHLTQKLQEWNKARKTPLYFASTYAVTWGQDAEAAEGLLTQLPPRTIPYAFSKALAERAITDGEIPAAIFRLGILVGNSTDGAVDKLDGAYSFVRLVDRISRLSRILPILPLPANPDGVLPLVPVDAAARVFQHALHHPEAAGSPGLIYGVYDTESISVRNFCESVLSEFAPGSRGLYLRRVPTPFLKLQGKISPIPADAFKFALKPVALANQRFTQTFSELRIPCFPSYRKAFFSGYRQATRGIIA